MEDRHGHGARIRSGPENALNRAVYKSPGYSGDAIYPGMLMAAARLDIPAPLVPGGPMPGGEPNSTADYH